MLKNPNNIIRDALMLGKTQFLNAVIEDRRQPEVLRKELPARECGEELADGKKPRKYDLLIIKGDRVIPVAETGIGSDGPHPNIVQRESAQQDLMLGELLLNPTASLKGKDK